MMRQQKTRRLPKKILRIITTKTSKVENVEIEKTKYLKNMNKNKSGLALLILEKIEFKAKLKNHKG